MTDLYSKYLACGGRLSTDSRSIAGGEIFFALRGDNFDGNDYALKALADGAAWAVVNEDASLPVDDRLIRVPDPYLALKYLAMEHRSNLDIPVIGLTGTNGKTTTKNLIAAVLSVKYKVTATQGNLNNDIGVPLSVLAIDKDTQIAIIEMGANHLDDITKLVKICQPNFGLVTNVGKAHLLGFGSFEGVKKAKAELYRWLGMHQGSVIFLNADDKDLRQMSSPYACHFYEYGLEYQGVKILQSSPESPYLRLSLSDGTQVSTHLVGSYNANNVLAALCVGEYFGISREKAIAAIESFIPANNRSQMLSTDSNSIIMDAYNANPSSISAALDNFAMLDCESKLALLGEMRELGQDSLREHILVVEKLNVLGLEAILVGEEFRKALEELNFREKYLCYDSSEELLEYLESNPVKNRLILLKGSRGVKMEKLLPIL